MYKTKSKDRKNRNKKYFVVATLVILAVAATVFLLEVTNTTYFFHHKSLIVKTGKLGTAGQDTKGEAGNSSTSNSTTGSSDGTSSTQESKDPTNGDGASVTLITPSGSFVSDHHPNLSGTDGRDQMQSVCNTSAGAKCQVTFTNNTSGVTASLPAQTADRGGAVFWSWKLKDIGLTQGSWKVQATATLGSQTKSASDAMTLEVQP